MEWIQAGFFWVTDAPAPVREPSVLPASIVTVSRCLAEVYPDQWALPWVEPTIDERRDVREKLGIADGEFDEIRTWIRERIDSAEFGWPNVFSNTRLSREFRRRFLKDVPGLRLLGLSMSRERADRFLDVEAPIPGAGPGGMWAQLRQGLRREEGGTLLGFDVLGPEFDGSLHSFVCNGLESEYRERLGVSFNRHGLIDDHAAALAASEYTNRDDVGAEPVTWYPWRVDEHGGGERDGAGLLRTLPVEHSDRRSKRRSHSRSGINSAESSPRRMKTEERYFFPGGDPSPQPEGDPRCARPAPTDRPRRRRPTSR